MANCGIYDGHMRANMYRIMISVVESECEFRCAIWKSRAFHHAAKVSSKKGLDTARGLLAAFGLLTRPNDGRRRDKCDEPGD